jgi:hypothetical protein
MPGGHTSGSNGNGSNGNKKKRDSERGIGSLTKGARRNMIKEQASLKFGTPLPARGACEHYRRSYRWLR